MNEVSLARPSTPPPSPSLCVQELRSGAVGGAEGGRGGGIADGDFWIGLNRAEGSTKSNSLTSCPHLYTWTDGSPAPFR